MQVLKGRREGGPSGMRVEDLKGWLREAKRKKNPVRRRWYLVVQLVQVTFGGGTVMEDISWAMMVLIPKGKGEYWGIRLVEVLWKVCSLVVNCLLKQSIMLHDALYGFREGRGEGTATLEANLKQQLTRLSHDPLFQVFLDVRKVYESPDRVQCLEILRRYGLGQNLSRLLKNYWKRQRVVPKAGKFLETSFEIGRGVTQGDPASPTINTSA